MTKRLPTCLRSLALRGLTLLEVMAGLAILATLLTAMLAAKAHARHQQTLAMERQNAIVVADSLVTQWWPDRIPQESKGTVDAFVWSTQLAPSGNDFASLHAKIVRLTLVKIGDSARDTPIVSLDLLIPAKRQ